jgi:hypothetical protein
MFSVRYELNIYVWYKLVLVFKRLRHILFLIRALRTGTFMEVGEMFEASVTMRFRSGDLTGTLSKGDRNGLVEQFLYDVAIF